MSNFICPICRTSILEDENTGVYMTGCKHYPKYKEKARKKPYFSDLDNVQLDKFLKGFRQ